MPIHNEPKVVADYIDHPIGLYGPKGGPFNGASMMILFACFGQYDERSQEETNHGREGRVSRTLLQNLLKGRGIPPGLLIAGLKGAGGLQVPRIGGLFHLRGDNHLALLFLI